MYFSSKLSLEQFFWRSHFIFQATGIYIVTSVSAVLTDFFRCGELESGVDLPYSTHRYKAFLSEGEAVWAEGHLINFCKDKQLTCVLGNGKCFGFLHVEGLSEQRQHCLCFCETVGRKSTGDLGKLLDSVVKGKVFSPFLLLPAMWASTWSWLAGSRNWRFC